MLVAGCTFVVHDFLYDQVMGFIIKVGPNFRDLLITNDIHLTKFKKWDIFLLSQYCTFFLSCIKRDGTAFILCESLLCILKFFNYTLVEIEEFYRVRGFSRYCAYISNPQWKSVNKFLKYKKPINAIFISPSYSKCDKLMNFIIFAQCDNFLQYQSFMMILVQH